MTTDPLRSPSIANVTTTPRNIDRLLAIWQGLWQDDNRKETWVTEQDNYMPNIMQLAMDKQKASTPLYPFRPTPTTWYDSDTMKQTKDFGYYYPETAGTTYPINETAKKALRAKISALYPSPARLLVMSKRGLDEAEKTLLPKANIVKSVEGAPAPAAVTATASRKLKDLIPADDKYLEWLVNIKAEKHALGGDYSVLIFLGPPDDTQPSQWQFSPLFVGAFYPFGQSKETGCANCQDAQRDHTNITGQIPLTLALMERYLVGIIPDMQNSTVVEYLKVNLHWRVRKVRFQYIILSHRILGS
jgi:tyrosinase